jgi:hypothetical protein
MIMKNHDFELYERSGEFEHGKLINGDEIWRYTDGNLFLYVYEDGIKIESVEGHEERPEEEIITDLRA